MGVAGAAWGTNVGRFAYTLMSWLYYGRGKATFQSKPFSLKRDKKITISVVHLGMASLLTIAITVGHESCTMTFHSVPVKTNCSYCSFSSIT